MPTFLKVRRNQLIIGGVLVLLLVLLGVFLFLPRNQPPSNTSSRGDATVSPSPSPDITPSPSPDISPSPSPSALPSASPPPAGQPIGAAGALLRAGPAPDDPALGFGYGPGCSIWHHSGWTSESCGIVQVNGTDAAHGVAYFVEHNATGGHRVSLMTTGASDAYWHVKLNFVDTTGSFSAITVRSADITGDGQPEILVGLSAVGTNHVLDLDGVGRAGTADPVVIIHRELVNGKATLSGGLTDYSAAGSGYIKTLITYSGGAFHGSSSTVATAPAGDFA